jgi:Protein tyrosine and serine/threonine kinase
LFLPKKKNVQGGPNLNAYFEDISLRAEIPQPVTTDIPTTGTTAAPQTTAVPTTNVATSTAPAQTTTAPATTAVPTTATTGVPKTTGVPTTTGDPVEGNTLSESSSSADTSFPIWIVIVAVAVCCCCVLFAALFFVRRRKKHSSVSSAVEVELFHDDDEEVLEYDEIAGFSGIGGSPNAKYASVGELRKAIDVAEEQQYASVAAVGGDGGAGIEGSYAKIPDFQAASEQQYVGGAGVTAASNNNESLNADDVLLDVSKTIGKGSFGDVYRGQYRGVDVAVKMLKDEFTEDQLQSFYDESATIASIPPHEFIVGFVGCCPAPFMIITEFCSQGSLLRFLRSGRTAPLTPNHALSVIKDIATGMCHLASHKIVHRDLAARNVLLTGKLKPKIADFGMSRTLEQGAEAHKTASAFGAARWMAVEAIKRSVFSEASDVWAFAVTAFECLTQGATPYGKNNPTMNVVREVIKGTRRLEFPETIPTHIDALLLSCLDLKPSKRPTFAEIVDRMEDDEEIVYADLSTFGTLDDAGGTGAQPGGFDFSEFRDE